MRHHPHRSTETTEARSAASSNTARFHGIGRTADSILALQRLTGNAAVTTMLQRQPRDPAGAAAAAADAPVLGRPASTGSATVLTVAGQDVPAQDSLAYPAIPAPDREYRYANYHRVRYLTVWVLSRIGPWVRAPRDDLWQRELEWGRLRLAATETWLIRKRWYWDTTSEVQRGTLYLASEPFATTVRRQGIMRPPAASPDSPPEEGAPLRAEDAPEASVGQAVAMQAARNASTWMWAPNAVRAATGQPTVAEPGAVGRVGGLFVLQSIIRAVVADNALMSSVFDQNALWVDSVPAPGSK